LIQFVLIVGYRPSIANCLLVYSTPVQPANKSPTIAIYVWGLS